MIREERNGNHQLLKKKQKGLDEKKKNLEESVEFKTKCRPTFRPTIEIVSKLFKQKKKKKNWCIKKKNPKMENKKKP